MRHEDTRARRHAGTHVAAAILCALAFFPFVPSCLHAAAPAAGPNIMVILCDDLGYGDLGCYGHPTIRTPHLDKLASQGMRLTDCYASAPVCSSSSK